MMSVPSFHVYGLDHVQLAMPPAAEATAREFYSGLLGLTEVPKPDNLAGRGGVWFEGSGLKLHLGVEQDFRPAQKAHPALLVRGLPFLIPRLQAAGVHLQTDEPLAGIDRVHVFDPFGNRLELMERRSAYTNPPDIRISDRHRLRLPSTTDAPELFQLIDSNRTHLRQWLPWIDATTQPDDTRRVIEAGLRQFANQQGFHAVITLDDRIIGVIGFHAIDWTHRNTSIGYWLDHAHQGQGLMLASCRAVVQYAFEVWNLNRIVIRCASGNSRSRAIPACLGFTQEGTQREAEWLYDHFVDLVNYSLLRKEWYAPK